MHNIFGFGFELDSHDRIHQPIKGWVPAIGCFSIFKVQPTTYWKRHKSQSVESQNQRNKNPQQGEKY